MVTRKTNGHVCKWRGRGKGKAYEEKVKDEERRGGRKKKKEKTGSKTKAMGRDR